VREEASGRNLKQELQGRPRLVFRECGAAVRGVSERAQEASLVGKACKIIVACDDQETSS